MIPWLHLAIGKAQYGCNSLDIRAQVLAATDLKVCWFEELSCTVGVEHLHVMRQEVGHAMVMPKDLLAVLGPEVVPDGRRVGAYAVHEPPGVVVQRDLHTWLAGYATDQSGPKAYVDFV